jgi:hypothetical protein
MALQRQPLGHQPVAVLDPQNLDTGVPPAAGRPVILDSHDVGETLQWGVKATVGYLFGSNAIELTGFYLPSHSSQAFLSMPGRIDTLFTPIPFGFSGDNNLFLQDDRLQLLRDTQLGSAELNYHYTDAAVTDFELIVGVRFLNLRERYGIFIDDDGIAFPGINGAPDPLRTATYTASTNNRIIAPQLGCEYDHLFLSWLSAGATIKGAWGVNLLENHVDLTRGDGFVGFSNTNRTTTFSHMYDLGVHVAVHFTERLRLDVNYNLIFLAHIANVQDQVDFNLNNPVGRRDENGNVYFHGPSVELQFLF